MAQKSRRQQPSPRASAPQQGVVDRAVAGAQQQQQQDQQQQQQQAVVDAVNAVIAGPLTALKDLRGKPVVAYVLTDLAQIADEQMMHLFLHLREIGKQDDIDLFLVSRGGASEVPWKIISLFREFSKRFSVLVPYRAHSAATVTALGADEIVMTSMAELGPIDPSRRHPMLPKDPTDEEGKQPLSISVQDLRHVLDFLKREMGEDLTPDAAASVYTALFDKVHPLAIGALEQSWALSIQIARQALETHMDPEADKDKIDHIVERLSDYYKSHLYQLNRQEARALELPEVDATPDEEDAMWALHQAFGTITLQADSEVNGQKMKAVGIGYIASSAGLSIGLGHSAANKPDRGIVAATWQSQVGDARPGASPPAASPEEE